MALLLKGQHFSFSCASSFPLYTAFKSHNDDASLHTMFKASNLFRPSSSPDHQFLTLAEAVAIITYCATRRGDLKLRLLVIFILAAIFIVDW